MAQINYDLEIDKVCEKIKEEKAKTVCIQLPDGLKPRGKEIADAIKEKTGSQVIIWAGSCYGACDVPLEAERLGAEMIIQWGHSDFGLC